PRITVSRLLKSWARPPVSWPTDSSRWARRSCSSRASRWLWSLMPPHHAHRLAGGVADDVAAIEHPGIAAVGAPKAVGAGPVAGAAVEGALDIGEYPVAIFRVDAVAPGVDGGLHLGAAVAEQGFKALAPP